MKKIMKLITVLILVIILSPNIQGLGEESSQGDIKTLISFNLAAEDRFIYEVRVSEGGYLIDGGQKITNGIMEYELSVGERKEFRLEAKSGYEVKEIRINDENLNPDTEKIKIVGVSKRSILEVRYGKLEKPIVPDIPESPDNTHVPEVPNVSKGERITNSIPVTGDTLRIYEYVCLMLIVLYRIYVSKRDIDTCIRVDNRAISKDIEKKEKTLKEEKKNEK